MSKTGTRRPNGSGTIRQDGYIQIKMPGHPVARKHGFAYLHRVILYDKIGPGKHNCYYCGTTLEWFVDLECDHKDHNKQNNSPENLVPCCEDCNRSRWNLKKDGCPKFDQHGPYDKEYKSGWRYCSKCKAEKEARRRERLRSEFTK